ncbi:hypothetical protein [Emticicia sp. TH156]|uniref:hypothetical protein n=1 Tax=Emticicia sp. TH156 TaxID=2067454 RepID=UPI000C790A0D|nr:hypothetical protein [Emticicia sp. TH156]PLK45476.1 hypothetical protein C0V77_04885 [Emticicia sp. TH156]
MNDLELVVPYTTENGNDYLIKFKKFINLDNIGIDIVDVSLIAANYHLSPNTITSFKGIAQIIKKYLLEHNVILYYYCDTSEVSRRDSSISPQLFRSKLFWCLINRYNSEDFYCKDIVIEDPEGNHYICLIAKEYSETQFNAISREIDRLK